MKRKTLLYSLLPVLAFSMLSVQGCGTSEKEQTVVSVSIEPLKYFVDHLTGNALEVNVMVPAGASHGTYSPTTSQMQKLSESALYLRIGSLGYEQAFISRLNEINPTMRSIDLLDGIELIRGEPIDHGDHVHEGGIDPHIWMSPKVMLSRLEVIRTHLTEVFPHLQSTIDANYLALHSEVERMHQQMEQLTGELTQRRFLIFHPALTYLARDYGLEQVSIEFEGKEPAPARLAQLIRDARAINIPVIFIQEEYDVRNAEIIAAETGAAVEPISTLSYNWMETMQNLMVTLEEHLK